MLRTPEELLLELGAAIKARRLSQNWSQAVAASRAGMGLRTWQRMEARGQATIENLVNAAIVLRCEERLAQLFPAPAAKNLDELLKQQAASPRPKRATRRAKTI